MRRGNYEEAIAKFTPISDYKDSAEKITECERNLLSKLAGTWHGTEGSVIVLNEDGSCHYSDSSNEGNGAWSVDDNNVIYITNDGLGYEIYADLENSYRTVSMMVKSDSSSWRNEEFTRLIDFSINPENNVTIQHPIYGTLIFGQNGENKISVLLWLYYEKWITFQCICHVLFVSG